MHSKRARGFTVIEMLIVALIITVVTIVAWRFLIQGAGYSVKLTTMTDLQRRGRHASSSLSRELRQSVEILYPQEGDTETSPLLCYLNDKMELIVIYADDQKRLMHLNRTDGDLDTVLSDDVEAFRVFRRGRQLINFHIHLKGLERKTAQGDKMQEFNLISGVTVRNAIN